MKNSEYEVFYYTLEPSYYDRSERKCFTRMFKTDKEAMDFVEEIKKKHPAQITMKKITEEFILDLRATDDYQENRVRNDQK